MDRPTAAQIRSWTNPDPNLPRFIFEEYGYPAPEGEDADSLEILIARFVEWLEAAIGYDIDDDEYPENLQERTGEAIQLGVLYKIVSTEQGIIETAGDFDLIQSFSAGSYSETRRGQGINTRALHPWPALNQLLNGLLSPDRLGQEIPAMGIVAPDWNVGKDIIDARTGTYSNYRGPSPLWVSLPLP